MTRLNGWTPRACCMPCRAARRRRSPMCGWRRSTAARLRSSSFRRPNHPLSSAELAAACEEKQVSKKIPQLDAVRGIAILLVILHNQSSVFPSLHLEWLFANGWMGVDLFFVLSGFLITGILVDTKASDGYVTNFYARRCLRIWPLYYALIVFMFIVVPLVHPSGRQPIFERSSPWWAYPLFLQNMLVPSPTMA